MFHLDIRILVILEILLVVYLSVEFKYKNNTYFLENEDDSHKLYLLNGEESSLVDEIHGVEINNRIDLFFDKKIFDGKSFSEIYLDVIIIDIE